MWHWPLRTLLQANHLCLCFQSCACLKTYPMSEIFISLTVLSVNVIFLVVFCVEYITSTFISFDPFCTSILKRFGTALEIRITNQAELHIAKVPQKLEANMTWGHYFCRVSIQLICIILLLVRCLLHKKSIDVYFLKINVHLYTSMCFGLISYLSERAPPV